MLDKQNPESRGMRVHGMIIEANRISRIGIMHICAAEENEYLGVRIPNSLHTSGIFRDLDQRDLTCKY